MKNEIIVDGVTYTPKNLATSGEVIVRTYSAGVHIGTIKDRIGAEIVLTGARRLWSWQKAFTLNHVAMKGVDRTNSRISIPVSEITLIDSIEIIPIAEGVDLSTTEK